MSVVSQQRDSFKAKFKKLEQELDKNKVITLSLREERDSLRKQVSIPEAGNGKEMGRERKPLNGRSWWERDIGLEEEKEEE